MSDNHFFVLVFLLSVSLLQNAINSIMVAAMSHRRNKP